MTAQVLQFAVSLAAILALAGLARWLGLGGDVRLRDAADACEKAGEALCGFDAADVALDRAGIGALLRDASGRVMLLRRHGVRFAARLLDSHAGVRLDRQFLTVSTGESSFGSVTLDLGDNAAVWAASLRRIGN